MMTNQNHHCCLHIRLTQNLETAGFDPLAQRAVDTALLDPPRIDHFVVMAFAFEKRAILIAGHAGGLVRSWGSLSQVIPDRVKPGGAAAGAAFLRESRSYWSRLG